MKKLWLIGLLAVLVVACNPHDEPSAASGGPAPEDRILTSFRNDIGKYALAHDLGARMLITDYHIAPDAGGFVVNVKWRARRNDPKNSRVSFYRWYQTELHYDDHGKFSGVRTNSVLPES